MQKGVISKFSKLFIFLFSVLSSILILTLSTLFGMSVQNLVKISFFKHLNILDKPRASARTSGFIGIILNFRNCVMKHIIRITRDISKKTHSFVCRKKLQLRTAEEFLPYLRKRNTPIIIRSSQLPLHISQIQR